MSDGGEKEIWSERAGLKDAFVTPMLPINLFLIPFIYLSRIYSRYTLTDERLIISKGILSKTIDEIELFRIKDTKVQQTMFQRIIGYGTVTVISTDKSGYLEMDHLPNAVQRREQIRSLANKSREQKGVRTIVNE